MPPCPDTNNPEYYIEKYYYWVQTSSSLYCIINVPQTRAKSPGTCSN